MSTAALKAKPSYLKHLYPNVGAGLLAKAVCQPMHRSTDPPPSRASPLPQGFGGVGLERVPHCRQLS
ncbi:hypothetical protein DA482_00960 [Pseudomonas fluorescens]|nr:hypothetical protein FIP59_15845 [Pseudomonas fluorescens]